MEVIWALITGAVSLPFGLFIGRWWGKRRTLKLFSDLRDSGDLVVYTKEQDRDKRRTLDLLHDGRDGEDLDDIVYDRRDSPERREDWAGAIRKGREFRGENE